MAQMTLLRPILEVNDSGETIAFYEEKLGFTCIGRMGDNPAMPTWCQLQRDNVFLMFSWAEPHEHEEGDEHPHGPALNGSIYITVDDVDAMHAELSAKVRTRSQPTTQPWGMREFWLQDCNGYSLVFGQAVDA